MLQRFTVVALVSAAIILAACGQSAPPPAQQSTPGTTAANPAGNTVAPSTSPASAAKPASDKMAPGPHAPNEAGQIMVLEYHHFTDDSRWSRSPQGFRQDLELLYEEGYRPVNMRDVVAGRINLPRGYSPVVLTFDDATPSQFKFLPDGSVDPNTAVGVLLAMHAAHPDWPLAGTFYVNDHPFGGKDWQQKLQFLVSHGFEIGNHTLTHANLAKTSPAATVRELGALTALVKEALPDYQMTTMALPFGGLPKDLAAIKAGSYNGVSYRLQAILLVGANPAKSPFDKGFNPYAIPRIQVTAPALKVAATFYDWNQYFVRNPRQRYVSDGSLSTLTVPAADKDQVRVPEGVKLILSGR